MVTALSNDSTDQTDLPVARGSHDGTFVFTRTVRPIVTSLSAGFSMVMFPETGWIRNRPPPASPETETRGAASTCRSPASQRASDEPRLNPHRLRTSTLPPLRSLSLRRWRTAARDPEATLRAAKEKNTNCHHRRGMWPSRRQKSAIRPRGLAVKPLIRTQTVAFLPFGKRFVDRPSFIMQLFVWRCVSKGV